MSIAIILIGLVVIGAVIFAIKSGTKVETEVVADVKTDVAKVETAVAANPLVEIAKKI